MMASEESFDAERVECFFASFNALTKGLPSVIVSVDGADDVLDPDRDPRCGKILLRFFVGGAWVISRGVPGDDIVDVAVEGRAPCMLVMDMRFAFEMIEWMFRLSELPDSDALAAAMFFSNESAMLCDSVSVGGVST